MLRFDRKQQNSVKQLSFNKTLIKKKKELQLPILQKWKLRPRQEKCLPKLHIWELVQCQS